MESLTHRLGAATQEQLQRLGQLWGLETLPDHITQVNRRLLLDQMRSPFAARSVWQHLDQASARCLYEIVTAPPKNGRRSDQLLKKTRLPAQAVEQALVGLQDTWLIAEHRLPPPIPLRGPRPPDDAVPVYLPLPECAEVLAQTGRERFTVAGDRSTWELRHLLERLPWDTFTALAQRCAVPLQTFEHWRPVQVSAFDVRALLCTRLTTSPAIFALLRALDEQALRLWLWLWDQGRSAPLATAQAALQLALRDLAELIPFLERQALVCDTLTPFGERLLCIPKTLYEQLQPNIRAWRAEQEAHAWRPLDAAPAPPSEVPPTLLYDLAALVGWVSQTTVEPTQAGSLPKRLRAQMRQRLAGLPRVDAFDQDLYPDLLLGAATDLRLVQRVTPPYADAKPRYAPGPALVDWGQAGLDGQATRALAWWQHSTSWQDLLPHQQTLPAYHWTEQDRTQVIEQLRRCAAGKWYPVSSLLHALWQKAPLDLSSSQRDAAPSPFEALQVLYARWQERAGQRALGILTSTLRELGLVELAGEALTVRLTDLGARVLGIAQAADQATPAPTRSRLIVQPSFELVCLQTHLPLLYTLLPWAEW